LVANALVFKIADYYAMPSLIERALKKLLARAPTAPAQTMTATAGPSMRSRIYCTL
jgi:hypothetical protein